MEKNLQEKPFSLSSHFSCPVSDIANIGDVGIDLFLIEQLVLARSSS